MSKKQNDKMLYVKSINENVFVSNARKICRNCLS